MVAPTPTLRAGLFTPIFPTIGGGAPNPVFPTGGTPILVADLQTIMATAGQGLAAGEAARYAFYVTRDVLSRFMSAVTEFVG